MIRNARLCPSSLLSLTSLLAAAWALGCGGSTGTTIESDAGFDACGETGCTPCDEGASCSDNPDAACAKGRITCGSGAPICVDDAPRLAGTACAGGVCSGAGTCVPCVSGGACSSNPNACATGVIDCSAGKPTCVDGAGRAAGTACAGGVCDGSGLCVGCVAGASCGTNTNACQTGRLECASGAPQCVNDAAKPAGTACSGGVCSGTGTCNACVAGQSCVGNANPCADGTVDCTSGAAVCVNGAPKAAGTACAGGVCSGSGTCNACLAGSACTTNAGAACFAGVIDCSSGSSICVDGTPRAAGTACPGGVCSGNGVCNACVAGDACATNPGAACRTGTVVCSSGAAVCTDAAAKANGTLCTLSGGAAGMCNAGGCKPETVLSITSNVADYDVFAALGKPTAPLLVTVDVAAGIVVSGSTNALPALSSGALPAGSKLHIVNHGQILGGRGTSYGAAGGTAVYLADGIDVVIDNAGTIYGAGGNGGRGGRNGGAVGFGASAQGATPVKGANGNYGGNGGGGGNPASTTAGGSAGGSDWYGAATAGSAGAGGNSCYLGGAPWPGGGDGYGGNGAGYGGNGAGYGGGGGGCSMWYGGGGGGGIWGGAGGAGGLDNALNGGAWGYTVNGTRGGGGGAAIMIASASHGTITIHALTGGTIAGAVWNEVTGKYYTGNFAALASTTGQSVDAPASIQTWNNGIGIVYR